MTFRREPLGQKAPRVKDPAYLAKVAELPCVICEALGEAQLTPTQVHHTIHGRYSQRKTPDRDVIPLCRAHHMTGEGGKIAIHREPVAWWQLYGQDGYYIKRTQDRINGGTK